MNKLFAVAKNELLRYFISPLAYVYLIAFLLLNGSFAVYFGSFFERGSADLSSMFAFQPWLYLLFIPGISMRLWSEEFRAKTVVQIMTMPVPVSAFVWGKFFAAWTFCALALFLTFPFWITVNILGTPDNGVIALSYAGSFVLAGCMLAISQTMSALTKNQVIALVLSVVANLAFFLSGLEYILAFVRLFLPLAAVDMIASFSFLTHFDAISRGLLELRDLIFFISLILLFNFTTVLIVSFKTAGTAGWLKSTSRSYYIFAFFCLLLGFAGLNLLANNLTRGISADFTEEKIFTLTDTTKNTLRYLPRPITAKLYYSPVLGERNPDLRLMFDKVRLLLRQYAALSGGRFAYRIYNPEPLDEIEDRAIAAGLQPLPVADLNVNAFFGLTLTDSVDNRQTIPFFALERQNFLEQDITQKIFELTHPRKKLGIITTLPVFDTVINNNVVSQEWQIIKQLKELYRIKHIKTAEDFPDDLDVLMIINPQNPDENLTGKIKRYSLDGGKVLLILDNAAEAPRIFSPVNHEYVPSYPGELAGFWGIRFRNDAVVADLDNSIMVDATKDYKVATGKAWFKVPGAIKFNLVGKPNKYISGKDVILHIIGMIGVDGALYKSMEFVGEGIKNLSMDDRFTIANMAIEAGGKNGIFPVDEKAIAYMEEHSTKKYTVYEADEDAVYDEEYTIDLSTLKSTVAFPHLPENTHTIDEIDPALKIDQVVIGSCTNGRIDDLRCAAEILKGRKVAKGMRLIVIPATQAIYLQAMEEGLLKIFIEAGGVVSTPTCGPCLGGYMGILAENERCVSTTNRNFVGRMGHVTSEIYLASPAVAAASAITGHISDPAKL